MSLLQIILIGIIFLIILGASAVFLINQEAERKKRIASVIKGHASTEKKFDVKDVQNKRRAEIAKKLKETREGEDVKKGKKKKAPITLQLERAGLNISVKKFWLFSFISMIIFLMLAKMMGQSGMVIGFAGVIGLFGFPKYVLRWMRNKRQKKFLMEMPDALEAMIRLLKAGMPVSEAIAMVSREFTGPVGEEMSRIYEKQKIGIAIHEAALEGTKRMPLPEMKMFATGLAIQAQTGSSLSEVLKNLATVIRARFRLKRKVKALSSEAIASASIIGALPNLVATGMYFANHDYIMVLFTDPFGKLLLGIAVGWMLVGIFVMKIMINFKV